MAPMVSGVPLPERSASIRESRRETILVRWLVLSCSPPPPDRGGGGARPNAWSPGVVLGALSAVNDIRALPAKAAPPPWGGFLTVLRLRWTAGVSGPAPPLGAPGPSRDPDPPDKTSCTDGKRDLAKIARHRASACTDELEGTVRAMLCRGPSSAKRTRARATAVSTARS